MKIPPVGTRYIKTEVPEFLGELANREYIKIANYRTSLCQGKISMYIGERLVGCGNNIKYNIKKTEDYIICPNCDNEYEYEDLFANSSIISEIVDINYGMIFTNIIQAIQQFDFNVTELEGYRGNYLIKKDDLQDEYLLMFSGAVSNKSTILDAIELKSGVMFIEISEEVTNTLPDNVLVISGTEILLEGFEKYNVKLGILPKSNEVISRLRTVTQVENNILELSKLISWQAVENEVTDFFLNELRCRVVAKYKYKNLLELFPQFALIPVNAAGAGNADKFTININDYLEELFEAEFTLDAKCYTSTSVNHNTMEKVLHHLSKNPLDAKRVIIIATTNNVTCWDDVWSFKNTTGKYKLIIFTAKIIAEISVHLDFHQEFLNVLSECIQGT